MARRSLREVLTGWLPRQEPTDASHVGAVLARHAEELMRTGGVMSVGVGANPEGDPVILVGISGHQAGEHGLPDSIEGVPVLVQEIRRLGAS